MSLQAALLVAALCGVAVAAPASKLPPIPGMFTASSSMGSLFMRGYDPMLGEPKANVLDFTYTNQQGNNNQWYDSESGKTYRLPDQVDIFDLPTSQTDYSMEFFSEVSEWNQFMAKEEWSEFDIIVVSFSQAQMNGYVKQTLSANETDIYYSQWFDTTYKMTCAWNPLIIKHELQYGSQVNSTFAQDQAALPKTRSSDADLAAYDTFLAKYGTHWVHDSVFGGGVQVYLQVNKSEILHYSKAYAAQQASFSLFAVFVSFGFDVGGTGGYSNITSDFKDASQLVIVGVGGNSAMIELGNYSHWSSSVHLNPAPLNATYQPISDLIYDSTKAANYAAHVKEYLKTPVGAPYNETKCASTIGTATSLQALPHPKSVSTADAVADMHPKSFAAAKQLPGLNSGIGQGFDVKKGQFMDNIATTSYNDGKMWYDPLTDTTYPIPDALTFIDVPAACFVEDVVDITSDSSFAAFNAEWSGFELGIMYDGFSLGISFSQELANARALTNNWSKGLSLLQRSQTLYKLAFEGNPAHFSSSFTALVNALPSKPSSKYADAVQFFGTHVVTGQEIGGYCNMSVVYDQSLHKIMSQSYIQEQIGLSFGMMEDGIGIGVDLAFGFAHMNKKVNETFASSSVSQYMCVGGDVTMLQSGNYTAWVESVMTDPAAIPRSLTLTPIASLIYDPVKRQLMTAAIQDYLKAT